MNINIVYLNNKIIFREEELEILVNIRDVKC